MSKKAKIGLIIIIVGLALFQYIQIYNSRQKSQDEYNRLLKEFNESKTRQGEISNKVNELQTVVIKTKRRPVIDIEMERGRGRGHLYIVNKGLEPAHDVQVQPLTDKLNQKHISILGNTQQERVFIGTLFSDDMSPSTQIRVRVYFRDSSSIRYKWVFLISRYEVKSLLREHYNKLPNGGNDYDHPVVEWKHGNY